MKTLAVPALAAAAVAAGGLSQLPGKAGCLTSSKADKGCSHGRVIATPRVVTVSPDGKSVYAAGGAPSQSFLSVLDRAANGTLRQKPGTKGCITLSSLARNCFHARAIETPTGLAVSPDGKSLYVSARNSGAIDLFVRARDGSLKQPAGTAACVSSLDTGGRCGRLGIGGPEDVAVTPDGKQVIAVGSAGIAVLSRSLQVLQSFGAVQAMGVAVTGDGANVYVVGGGGGHGYVYAFSRDSSGKLAMLGCIGEQGPAGCTPGRAIEQAARVAVSADGKNVYVASAVSNGVASFLRTPTGRLIQLPGRGGCVTLSGSGGTCGKSAALDFTRDVAVSADGTRVFVASADDRRGGVVVLSRDGLTGRLTPSACYSTVKIAGCHSARNILGASGLALGPAGTRLYVASEGTGNPARGGGIAVFAVS